MFSWNEYELETPLRWKQQKKDIGDILIRQLLKQQLIGVTYTNQEALQ